MRRLKWFIGFVTIITIGIVWNLPMASQSPNRSLAQDGMDCAAMLESVINTVDEVCGGLGSGQACYGSGSVTATGDAVDFSENGDLIALEDIEGLKTVADADSEIWGVVVFQVAGANEDAPITFALFGDAEVQNAVTEVAGPAVTLEVRNGAGYNVNLREGPSTDYAVAGTFSWNATGIVDGRSADGEWLRLQQDSGSAWVFKNLVVVTGDPNTLPIVSSPYTQPMQALTLSTAVDESTCGIGSVGLLVQYEGETAAQIGINGADLTLATTTLLVQAEANNALTIHVLAGSVIAKAEGKTAEGKDGARIVVPLGGDDGLTVAGEPTVDGVYPFALTEGIPLGLVTDTELACIVAPSEDTLAALRLPDANAGVVTELNTQGHYLVLGWATSSDDDSKWWQIQTGNSTSWVPQDAVQTAGTCGLIDEVTLSTVAAPSNNVSPVGGTGSGLVPAGQTIWMASTGPDNMSGTCNYPPLVMCDHLVAISASGDTLSWRGQEPTAYTLYRAGENAFSYSGRNKLNNASMNMYLTFTSVSNWTMTMTQVFDNDPACTHTFYYTAIPR